MDSYEYYKRLVGLLEANAGWKKTAKGFLKQVSFAAGGTIVGGVVDRRRGALVGGILGALIGFWVTETYDSMLTHIRNLNDADKEHLVKAVQELVGSKAIEALMAYFTSNVQRELLIELIRTELKNKRRE